MVITELTSSAQDGDPVVKITHDLHCKSARLGRKLYLDIVNFALKYI